MPASSFYSNRYARDGLTAACRPCVRVRVASRPETLRNFLSRIVSANRRRAADIGVAEALAVELLESLWAECGGVCVLTGVAMTHTSADRRSTAFYTNASLDRVDPAGGYVAGNVRLVCCWANLARQTMTDAQLADWCRMVVIRAR